MEQLADKYQSLGKSQSAFERALQLYNNPPKIIQEQALQEALTASVIKHFELFYETFCKYLRLYLFVQHGIDVTGSRTIFRACYDQKIINETDLKQLFEVIEIRNATTHVYDEERAQKLSAIIVQHVALMKKVVERVKV